MRGGGSTLKRILVGFAVAACTGAAFRAHVVAQQGGRQVVNPTEKQWSESKEAQAHIAAAMAIAKPDLVQEAENSCTRQGPPEARSAAPAGGAAASSPAGPRAHEDL